MSSHSPCCHLTGDNFDVRCVAAKDINVVIAVVVTVKSQSRPGNNRGDVWRRQKLPLLKDFRCALAAVPSGAPTLTGMSLKSQMWRSSRKSSEHSD